MSPKIVLSPLALILVLATALPLTPTDEWWIRSLDFPRSQLAVLLMITGVLYLLTWNPKSFRGGALLLLILASAVYQGYMIFPYTPLASRQVLTSTRPDHDGRLRLLVANVLMTNRESAKFMEIARAVAPDLILAVETDRWWEDALKPLEATYPYRIVKPLGNTYGMLLYSRLELVDPEVRFLVEPEVPSIRTLVRLESGDLVELYGLHPQPPPQQDTAERDAELLITGKEARKSARPVLVIGDLNDVGWSDTTKLFQEISGLLDPRLGRGLYNTFHAGYPLLRWPLDHIFHSSHFKLVSLQVLDYFGSDHFPIAAELSYEPEAALQQEAPSAEPEDNKEANDKIDKVQELIQ